VSVSDPNRAKNVLIDGDFGNSERSRGLGRIMRPGIVVRIARPTDNLEALARMYVQGLGFETLASFTNHDGFDGVILGQRKAPYHLEFTSQRGHTAGHAPTRDHLLVFYIPERTEWELDCDRLSASGFREVRSLNPFWDRDGRTYEDVDGYRVVLQNAPWDI